MKIALYIEDGLEQIVLTPESDTEKLLLSSLRRPQRELHVLEAQLYLGVDGAIHRAAPGYSRGPDSTFIVLKPKRSDA